MRTRFEVTILGNTSPFPAKGRQPTSQVLNINERLYLIDCGEGAQIRMEELGVKRMRIDHIFISHLHGDHFYGLFGLLGSYRVLRRETPLHIHCPAGLKELIELDARLTQAGDFQFPVHFHIKDARKPMHIVDNEDIDVFTVPLKHGRMETTGFLFREKPLPRKMRKEKIAALGIPYTAIPAIKAGENYRTPEGRSIPNAELTLDPPPARSYAFCSDTAYHIAMVPQITGVDVLYHESTFSVEDGVEASKKGHSTAVDAAKVARKAKVGELLLGHFSTRYHDLEALGEEARAVFPRTRIAHERQTFAIGPQV